MHAVTRRRAGWLAGTILAGYGLAIVTGGLGLALGGGARHWLLSAALVMLALALAAGLLARVVLLYLDPEIRKLTWTRASTPMRVFRIVALVGRAAAAIVLLYLASGALRTS